MRAGTFIILVMLMVISTQAMALSGARLLGQSSSGQTALFNLGTHDGVKEGDYAVIVKEIRDLDTKDLRLVPVAKAKNIKINTDQSVWILFKIYDPELLIKGQQFLILSESTMLSGRRDPRFGRISVLTEKDKAAEGAKNVLSGDKDRIAKLKHQYPEIETLHKPEVRSDSDGELVDVEGWKKFKNDKYRVGLYKSPYQEDFNQKLKLATFEKMVTAYLKKVNDPKFNYEEFYEDQMKEDFANEYRKKSYSSEYESYMQDQKLRNTEDAKLYRKLLENGEAWSEDFSDEELAQTLNRVSVLQEKDRKKYVVASPKRYTGYLDYGMNLTDAQTKSDTGYRRDNRYSIGFEFEAIPLLKHASLERFTLSTSFRSDKSAFSTGSVNANLDETSFTGGANWYPLYAPYALESPAVFIGAYFRSGWAYVTAPSINEKANYTVLTMPGVRAGMKYNFRNNIGLRITASLETLNLDRYGTSSFTPVLPSQAKVSEGKMNFSLAYSF